MSRARISGKISKCMGKSLVPLKSTGKFRIAYLKLDSCIKCFSYICFALTNNYQNMQIHNGQYGAQLDYFDQFILKLQETAKL